MVTFIVLHLVAGLLLGGWFRFAILLPAFAVVAIEAAVAGMAPDLYPLAWPWYAVLLVGIILVEVGYVIASVVLRWRRAEKPAPSATPSVSTPD